MNYAFLTWMYVCVYVHMHVCIHVCIICMHVHGHKCTRILHRHTHTIQSTRQHFTQPDIFYIFQLCSLSGLAMKDHTRHTMTDLRRGSRVGEDAHVIVENDVDQ